MVECNFSCPQMKSSRMGSDVGQNNELVRFYTMATKRGTKLPVIAKMTPDITHIEEPSLAAKHSCCRNSTMRNASAAAAARSHATTADTRPSCSIQKRASRLSSARAV